MHDSQLTTSLTSNLENADKPAADRRRSGLADIHGDRQARRANSQACDGPASINEVQITPSSGHESTSQTEHSRRSHDRLLASELLRHWKRTQRAKEAACLKGRHDVALNCVACRGGDVAEAEVATEGIQGHRSSDHSCVVAHGERRHGRHEGNEMDPPVADLRRVIGAGCMSVPAH
jgi:hypothetical protein